MKENNESFIRFTNTDNIEGINQNFSVKRRGNWRKEYWKNTIW